MLLTILASTCFFIFISFGVFLCLIILRIFMNVCFEIQDRYGIPAVLFFISCFITLIVFSCMEV